jgi:hypothetical protein
MKFTITESKREKAAFHWLKKHFNDVVPYRSDYYPDNIFFIKDGEVVFEFFSKNNTLSIKRGEIWSVLESLFGLGYFDVQWITTEWINDVFNLNAIRSHEVENRPKWRRIESEFNNK